MEKSKIYNTSLDLLAKILTFTILGIIGIVIVYYFRFKSESSLIGLWILVPVTLLSYAFSPKHYCINEGKLLIVNHLNKRNIDLKEIKSVQILNKSLLAASIRTFGVGGLFGYFGRFNNYTLGSMTWYVSNRKNVVLLQLNDKTKIVLSPDNKEEFYNDLSKLIIA